MAEIDSDTLKRKIVWRFEKYDIDTDKTMVSPRYATLECIERIIRGAVLKDSARNVDDALVDVRGFYVGPSLDP